MPIIVPLQVEHHLVGLEEHVNIRVNKLEHMFDSRSLLCLVDVVGIGKTSLAKIINWLLVINFKPQVF
jgi:ABC-type proline/glycine betaine transport system ATPase subunit